MLLPCLSPMRMTLISKHLDNLKDCVVYQNAQF